MRIIAGNLKGKKLKSPTTDKTRPTLDRVKEAVFSMVSSYTKDAKVLDLFAGTGSLALEMISRGASFCLINDREKNAISTILFNIQLTNTEKYVKISMKDYLKCLKKITQDEMLFDVIFIDPPYNSDYAIKSLQYISDNKGKVLTKDGIVVYESDKSFLDNKYDNIENLECINTKFYGRVVIKIYKWR
ncbi:MAG: 16S rRNA (guanine(966)-N(2))-methyltransferase RsmD [Clostridia bacterium]|nr:16S rRNA (guanine(966)-N(2))-methyltransferase RsmD [Clostridia bacterium]MDD4386764.1 16S rRNA (guanine(966)-N(2))-methyltransferase RsmD [Clostridia bacterium]